MAPSDPPRSWVDLHCACAGCQPLRHELLAWSTYGTRRGDSVGQRPDRKSASFRQVHGTSPTPPPWMGADTTSLCMTLIISSMELSSVELVNNDAS